MVVARMMAVVMILLMRNMILPFCPISSSWCHVWSSSKNMKCTNVWFSWFLRWDLNPPLSTYCMNICIDICTKSYYTWFITWMFENSFNLSHLRKFAGITRTQLLMIYLHLSQKGKNTELSKLKYISIMKDGDLLPNFRQFHSKCFKKRELDTAVSRMRQYLR